MEKIYDFDYIVCPTELDALVLESSTIKLYNPKYNILLKDDKGYNYIRITGGDYPRMVYALNTADKDSVYIGPYTNGYNVNKAIDEANGHFLCSAPVQKTFRVNSIKDRPCLNYHIKHCMGVLSGNISSEEYKQQVKEALDTSKAAVKRELSE